jgi:3-oxoacyl-[acyl-carrier protein] reductase
MAARLIDPRLDGRVALVTGANCGIGAAIAEALAGCGVAVLVGFLRLDPSEHADDPAFPAGYGRERSRPGSDVAAAIVDAGGTAVAVEADLADPAAAAVLFDRAEAELGPVEILVSNASSWVADTFLPDTTDRFGRRLRPVSAATFDRQFAVDARATALLIAEFGRRHLDRGAGWGRIVGLTSGGAEGFPGEVSYGAAKAAMENYLMSAAWELGPFGVTANVVYPPATDTGWVTAAVEADVLASTPLRHVGQPEEVAEVVLWLASHQARFVTAERIRMR